STGLARPTYLLFTNQASSGPHGPGIQPFRTVFNTDYVSAGLRGLRGVGTGQIPVAGVSGTVTRAYLYWQGPTNSSSASANAAVTFAGTPIVGTQIGFSRDNCWGVPNRPGYPPALPRRRHQPGGRQRHLRAGELPQERRRDQRRLAAGLLRRRQRRQQQG